MCLIATALSSQFPTTEPSRIRPSGEVVDRSIADDETLDDKTRIAARERLGIPPAEVVEGQQAKPLGATTDEEIEAGVQSKFTGVDGPLVSDNAAVEARRDAMEKLFPSSPRPNRIGIPGFGSGSIVRNANRPRQQRTTRVAGSLLGGR